MAANSGHDLADFYKRVTSQMVVLRLLKEEPMYGYQISQEVKARSGGIYAFTILYPILRRLEDAGYIRHSADTVVDGRARTYYEITADGERYLEQAWSEYQALNRVFTELMESR